MPDTAVLERLDDIETMLKGLPVPEYVGIQFVAAKLGVSGPYLKNHRELLPSYGVTEVPGKSAWSLKTVRDWLKVSPAEHAADWERLPTFARREIAKKWSKQ